MLEFISVPITLDAAAGEESPRTITGVAVPWDTPAVVSSGEKVQFSRGAFDLNAKAPKLLEGHDMNALRGVVTEMADSEQGLLFTAKFAKTAAAQDAIELVKAGAYDSVSVGAIPKKYKYDKNGTMVVSEAQIIEISLVAQPAFEQAVITEIAASQPENETSEPEADEPQPDTIPEEETMSNETTSVEASAEIVETAPIFAQAKAPARLLSAAEYIAGILKGGEAAESVRKQLRAAAPFVDSSTDGGLLPEVLISPVYDNFIGNRPVVDACGVRAMPADGAVFRVPYVSTHSSIAQQAAEHDTLQASLYAVSSYDITKLTFGGYSTVSEQIIDWSSPEIVGSMLNDMGRVYAYQTDNYAADQLLAGCSQSAVLTDPTSPSEWVSDIYDAAVTIINNSNGNVPTHLFLSPNMFGYLGKLVDTTGRPLLAPTMPMNAFGSQVPSGAFSNGSAFGLQVVVDRGFAADTVIVGDPSGYQIWEQQKGAISIDNPSSLSRTIAFRGYFATKMVDATKFVKLT